MPGNVADRVRSLRDKTKRALEAAEKSASGGSSLHPSNPRAGRKKPKATSMAPREGNKRSSYGRALPETASEERKRKGK